MSLSLLLEKYDVSTEDGLQKALGEIEKEEVPSLLRYLRSVRKLAKMVIFLY